MARPLRVEFAGACYHVINRGNYRRNLFAELGAAQAFEKVLGEAAVKFGWKVHAYVIMRNHFHLAVEIDEPNLSEGMKWLQGTWIRRYNGFRKLVGRPFQGRYKALLVERGHSLAQVCHYIHLNPVRAKVVTAEHIMAYKSSSLAKFEVKPRAEWLDPEVVLSEAGDLPDTQSGWKHYRSYLCVLAEDEQSKRELHASKLSRGWCIGTKEFKDAMRAEARDRGLALHKERFEGLEPGALAEERAQQWEERLQAFAQAAKIDLARLASRKSDPHKALLAAALKKSTSVANAWLAQRLAMGAPASASQFARRYLLTKHGKASVEAILSRVKT